MRTWHTCIIAIGVAMSACENKSEIYEGTEVFGVPALENRGLENAKLKEVLPPGVEELDLGMTRKDVAAARKRHFQQTGPTVHGLNRSTIELHQFDSKAMTSPLPIDRLELRFDEDTDLLCSIWARSEYGTATPADTETLVNGLVEVFGEPQKLVRVPARGVHAMLWEATENGSGVKVMLRKNEDFRPTVDFYAQTRHELTEADSGLNNWIASGTGVTGINALEFTREFIASAFPGK